MKQKHHTAVLALVLTAACSSPIGSGHGGPDAIQPVGGTAVSVEAGTTASDSLAVRVIDAAGRGVEGVQVTWLPGSAVAVPTRASTTTMAGGVARTGIAAGTVAGQGVILASVAIAGSDARVAFTVIVDPGPTATLEAPASVTLAAGSNRTITLVARDQYGNGIPTAAISWASTHPAIAEGTGAGTINGKALGGARLTATAGAATAQFDVWVVPAAITSCEQNTGTVCGSWTLQTDRYHVVWTDGATSTMQVIRFNDSGVEFQRSDLSLNNNFSARYVGALNGRTAVGQVTWTQNYFSWSGTWNAEW